VLHVPHAVLGGVVLAALTSLPNLSLGYFGWLLDLTLLAVLAPLPHRRLSPTAGAVIIGLYLALVALLVAGV
jgi:Ca2+/Na+ antiporter